jgi:hypothetical protein
MSEVTNLLFRLRRARPVCTVDELIATPVPLEQPDIREALQLAGQRSRGQSRAAGNFPSVQRRLGMKKMYSKHSAPVLWE